MSKPFSNLTYRFLPLPLLMVLGLAAVLPAPAQTQQGTPQSHDPLAEILLRKGILTPDDMRQIERATSPQQAEELMARILLDKGVLSKGEYEQVAGTPPAAEPVDGAPAPAMQAREVAPSASTRPAAASQPANAQQASSMQAPSAAASAIAKTEKPAPHVIDALAPIRLLPVGGVPSSTPEPAFKAEGVGVTPYGFVRATAIEDSSDPTGDDFPMPGFLSDTPPDGSPEFHLKARSTRFGLNFNVFDSNPKWVISGRVEADFEGNFNRSDNRNLSSIRSSNPSLRVAWGRLDYHFDDRNTFSALAGQDWTIFASSTLANIVEVTGIGIGFGGLWERDPQMRVGYTHKFGGFSIMPEFAIDLPGSGLPPSAANISEQLGYGERQGPDSNRPQIQGRLVGQWQLDHAAGVAPAQIIFSGFRGKRTANVLASSVLTSSVPAIYQAAFPKGLSASSKQNGWDGEWQLPTRWFTLTGKVYSGADLRWFFGGQLYSFFCDTHGLTNTVTVASVGGASNVVLGTNASGQPVVAPERPIRAAGGFAQLGLPLSRIFDANPRGRNSGWSIYALYGVDQAKVRDVNRLNAPSRHASTMAVGTLNFKLNKWIMFSFDESLFTTHANPEQPLPLYRGVPSREWKDLREEFGPTFTF